MNYQITASIVLYKNNFQLVEKTVKSFLAVKSSHRLYLIDNSPTDELRILSNLSNDIEYIKTEKNLGFGKAHNIALRKAIKESKYHIVLNPDIYFDEGEIEKIYNYMEATPEVAQVMPKVLYTNGEIQKLCKLLPTPADLFLRRFFPWFPGAKERNSKYELSETGYDKIMNIPYLSGCFMFLRTSAIRDVGVFDERIFMYIEDADLTRRLHQKFKTVFFPGATVYHHYEKGSYKNFKLMLYNIHGAFIYFTKWGWIFDSERREINGRVIQAYLMNKR